MNSSPSYICEIIYYKRALPASCETCKSDMHNMLFLWLLRRFVLSFLISLSFLPFHGLFWLRRNMHIWSILRQKHSTSIWNKFICIFLPSHSGVESLTHKFFRCKLFCSITPYACSRGISQISYFMQVSMNAYLNTL